MIRTLVEIRNGRVSIRENADETTVTVTLDGAPSDVEGLNRSTVLTLKQSLEQKTTRISALENRVTNLLEDRRLDRQTIGGLQSKVEGYDLDRKTERDRADQNKAWAERTEAELERRTQERDEREAARASLEKENAWLHKIVQQVNGEVHGSDILDALQITWERRSETMDEALADAVRKVREIVTAPRPDASTTPRPETSQA